MPLRAVLVVVYHVALRLIVTKVVAEYTSVGSVGLSLAALATGTDEICCGKMARE